MHTICVNMVKGCSYKDFSTQNFVIQKFYNMKISNLQLYQ